MLNLRLRSDLLLLNLLSGLLILVIYVIPDIQPLRVALGLPLILFFPGYTLIAALFPKKSDLDTIERVALSCGIPSAVVPLGELTFDYARSARLLDRLGAVLYHSSKRSACCSCSGGACCESRSEPNCTS